MPTQCPCCGSYDLEDETAEHPYTPPYGEPGSYRFTIQRCRQCREAGDFVGTSSDAIRAAIHQLDQVSAISMLDQFAAAGISPSYIERVLRLPAKTVARWREDISAEGLALLRVIRTYPWILLVAAARFDADIAAMALYEVVETARTEVVCAAASATTSTVGAVC